MKKIKKKKFSPVIRNNRPRNVLLQKETLSFILSLIYPIAKNISGRYRRSGHDVTVRTKKMISYFLINYFF